MDKKSKLIHEPRLKTLGRNNSWCGKKYNILIPHPLNMVAFLFMVSINFVGLKLQPERIILIFFFSNFYYAKPFDFIRTFSKIG